MRPSDRILMKNKRNHKINKNLNCELEELKKQIQEERLAYIHETLERSRKSADDHSSHHQSLALNRSGLENINRSGLIDLNRSGLEDIDENHDITLPSTLMKETTKNSFEPSYNVFEDHFIPNEVILPSFHFPLLPEKPPNYTTWSFINRNELMDDDDSMIGVNQICYENGEPRIWKSDSKNDEEEIKKAIFSEGEDRIIWKIGENYGLNDDRIQNTLSDVLGVDISDVMERFNMLQNIKDISDNESSSPSGVQDTLDKLFCRRCLVFDCRMHGIAQPLIYPQERKSYMKKVEDVKEQCSEHCYLKLKSNEKFDSDNKVKNVISNANTKADEIIGIKGLLMLSQVSNEWDSFEKELYFKGIQIFGKNSCLITKNLLSGLKTCMEVYNYMFEQECNKEHNDNETNNKDKEEVPRKSCRLIRKKGTKYGSYPSAWKLKYNDEPKSQYSPCDCKSMCDDQCPCLANGNCCEKYCGCSKMCKNRSKGCYCAKGKCRTRKCPCFAINRECDPDVCHNCSIGCGDGSLDRIFEKSQCENMKFLLKEHERILLGKSDVAGWGAFIKNPVKKNEHLGEYTGELISHQEAEERGKFYDILGTSYLFNLDKEMEIDARRKGNKLKFLNHSSSKPNCYAKMMSVGGEHRIGLYADKGIEGGEELLFNYLYNPSAAPSWSETPTHHIHHDEAGPSKREPKPKKDPIYYFETSSTRHANPSSNTR